MPERVLVVDDDPKIASFLRRGLAAEGYQVAVAHDGEAGLADFTGEPADLVILDVMMPGLDGLEVCRRLRRQSDVPILLLTARDEVPDRVRGLDAGADDYLVKPFAFAELLARLRALSRRRPPGERPVLAFADLSLDTATRQVHRAGREVELTAKEFDLLLTFMRHPRQVLGKELLLTKVWGFDFAGESNVVEVYVGYLRQKLEAGGGRRLIQTVRGAGYALRE